MPAQDPKRLFRILFGRNLTLADYKWTLLQLKGLRHYATYNAGELVGGVGALGLLPLDVRRLYAMLLVLRPAGVSLRPVGQTPSQRADASLALLRKIEAQCRAAIKEKTR